ncbi:N/A [soil metagenome]
MQVSAQDLLNDIDSLNVAEQIPNLSGKKFVVFNLGDELFAVSAGLVSEVIQPLEITPLPKVPEWLLGVTNIRGEVVSIINLPELWQSKIPKFFAKPKLIILRGQIGTIALATDGLCEIITLPDETVQPCEENSRILANVKNEEKNLQIIDPEALFSAIASAV